MSKKSLPLGVQNFKKLREEGSIYVDKTELIYQLAEPYLGLYFLSRPRRFGKSLLLSTIACLFEGKKELFEGLWIHDNGDWDWKPHPIVFIDFNKITHKNPDALEESIHEVLDELIKTHDLEITAISLSVKFSNIITAMAKKSGADVVVLIDEYDKPLTGHLGKGDEEAAIAVKNREVLKTLFGTLKAEDVSRVLRFVFLTGVSKFARVSVFSDLNNLMDLTMRKEFSTLLGYTEEELYHYFPDYIKELGDELSLSEEECKKDLRTWYNGYRFSKTATTLYNPFSILNAFSAKEFQNYWFESGTPTFLTNLIEERNYPVVDFEHLELRERVFSQYEINNLSLEALLFQTGYLTIKGQRGRLYKLSYPNQEVKSSFTDYLYEKIVKTGNEGIKNKFTLLADLLAEEKLEEFISTVNIILASITYHQAAGQDEAYFHTVFYLMLSASGVEVLTEVLTSQGRMDIAVFFDDKIYIIELKCNQSADKAINQIKEKKYPDKYKAHGKKILLMGINFDTEKREVTGWKFEG